MMVLALLIVLLGLSPGSWLCCWLSSVLCGVVYAWQAGRAVEAARKRREKPEYVPTAGTKRTRRR